MTKDEKTEYWKGIEDAYINPSQTSWIKMALIRKLQRQVNTIAPPTHKMNSEPSKPDSSTWGEGKMVTLKHRNHLQEFHEHVQGLNRGNG